MVQHKPLALWGTDGKTQRRLSVGGAFFLFVLLIVTAGAVVAIELPRTGISASVAAGDDGATNTGIPWPFPRFSDNGDGTVTDHLTDLVWLKQADYVAINTPISIFLRVTWGEALNYSNNLASGQCGLADGSTAGDRRLPNIKELISLFDYSKDSSSLPDGHLFDGVQDYYWSSTTVANVNTNAYYGIFIKAIINADTKNNPTVKRWVWPVREAGSSLSTAEVAQTGQTTSYAAGDDGDLQIGAPLPVARFTDNGDGTVTDELTGLIWLQDAGCASLPATTWAAAVANAQSVPQTGCVV